MSSILLWVGIALVAVALLLAIYVSLRQWRWRRRERALRALMDGADQLEVTVRECRTRLGQAHAAVNVLPQLPAAGDAEARHAVDQALRELLAHRLWIRDQAQSASQTQLDAAVDALTQARQRIDQQLADLGQAQRELDAVLHEHQRG